MNKTGRKLQRRSVAAREYFSSLESAVSRGRLLVADGLDRVEVGGFFCGIPSEEDAGDGADEERE